MKHEPTLSNNYKLGVVAWFQSIINACILPIEDYQNAAPLQEIVCVNFKNSPLKIKNKTFLLVQIITHTGN